MEKFANNCCRAVLDGTRVCPDLSTSALAVALEHPRALESFGVWAAGQIAGDAFVMVFWATMALLAFWLWPRLPAPVRRAALKARGLPQNGPENADELLDKVFALEREIGRLQGRLQTEKELRSAVRKERDRLLRDLEAGRAERRRLQERLQELERPWWRKILGGGS